MDEDVPDSKEEIPFLLRARLAAAPAAVSTAGGRLLVTLRPPRAYQVRTMHHRPPRACANMH